MNRPALRILLVAAAVALLVAAASVYSGWRPWSPPVTEARATSAETAAPSPARVAALGRLEPRHGVRRVAGPPRPVVVIEELRVEEGDRVERGDVIAVLAGSGLLRAEIDRLRAELQNATRELERRQKLSRNQVVPSSELEAFELARDVARANLERVQADLALSVVRSPITGQVLEIHAREGERVGIDGIAELGETAFMYAIAEVYETDIGRVRPGQVARVRSPALPKELRGEVERVAVKVDKNDVLSTDPVADADARVVEVEIRLAESDLAASLTNLSVEVEIETDREGALP